MIIGFIKGVLAFAIITAALVVYGYQQLFGLLMYCLEEAARVLVLM